MASWSEAVATQTKDKREEEVLELVLDTCKATKVSGLEKFSNLRILTLNGCGLTTLEDFPTLPKLQRLELNDNNLSDGLEALQEAGLVQLKSLRLAGNKFSTLDALEPLASLPNLRDLDMFTCAVTELEDYRARLFEMMPVLKFLDGFDAEENEKEEEEDVDDEDEDEDDEEDDLLDSEDGTGFGDEDGDVDDLESEDGIEPSIDDSEFEEGEEGEELFEEDGEEEEVGEDEADSEIEGDAKRQRR